MSWRRWSGPTPLPCGRDHRGRVRADRRLAARTICALPCRSMRCSSTCTGRWSPSIWATARASCCAGVREIGRPANTGGGGTRSARQRLAEMVAHSDALVAYRTYPHVDMAETGARCLPVIERLLAGERLHKAFRRGGFLVGLPWQCTSIEPGRALYAEARGARGGHAAGRCRWRWAFRPPTRHAVGRAFSPMATTAEAAVDALARSYAAAEPRVRRPAVVGRATRCARAMGAPAGKPVVLADTQDNPGGGGTGDTTGLLAALIEGGAGGCGAGAALRRRRPPVRRSRPGRARCCVGCPSAAGMGPQGRGADRRRLGGRAAGRRPVQGDRAVLWRQPDGSGADGGVAAAGGAGRRPCWSRRGGCRRRTRPCCAISASSRRSSACWR